MYGQLQNVPDEIWRELGVSAERAARLNDTMEALKEHDPATVEHCLRVAVLVYKAGKELNLSPVALFYAGLLHDFGKFFISREVLSKHGASFTGEDFEQIKEHPLYGYQVLKDSYPFSAEILVRHHYFQHNRYPDPLPPLDAKYSLAETELIEQCAKILAVADFYDAFRTRGQREGTVREALAKEYSEQEAAIGHLFAVGLFEE